MHEMSLAESVIQLIEEAAIKEKFSRVKTVCLEIGKLSHVEPEAMQFCFDSVSEQTLAEGAILKIIPVAGIGHCENCERDVEISQLYDPCSLCGNFGVVPITGTEMRIKELEVE